MKKKIQATEIECFNLALSNLPGEFTPCTLRVALHTAAATLGLDFPPSTHVAAALLRSSGYGTRISQVWFKQPVGFELPECGFEMDSQ